MPRRRPARENPLKTRDKALIAAGGVAALAVVFFATRSKTAATGGAASLPPSAPAPQQPQQQPPQPQQPQQAPPPPDPNRYASSQDFARDLSQWFTVANQVLRTFQVGSEMFNVLYRTMQQMFSNFGFLLPANPLPVF